MLAAVLVMAASISIPNESSAWTTTATPNKDMQLGGDVDFFKAWVAQVNRTNQLAVISGKCWSSCALLLGARNVCIYPSATIHFHGVHGFKKEDENIILPEDNTSFIATLPVPIQDWITEHNAMATLQHVVMTGSTAIGLGIANCNILIKSK